MDEVGSPTILATLTVIAALLPMAFVSGLMGPYMSPIPINSSLGMAISLAIAFTVTPGWRSSSWVGMAPHPHGRCGAVAPAAIHACSDCSMRYCPLPAKCAQALVVAGGASWLRWRCRSVLAVVQWVVLKMLPFDNKSEFQVVVEMPAGTPWRTRRPPCRNWVHFWHNNPKCATCKAMPEPRRPLPFNGLVRQYYLRADAEQGDLQVNLVDKHHRSERATMIAQRLRPELEAIGKRHQARVKVVEVPPGRR